MSDSIVCRFVSMIFRSEATSFSVGRFSLYELEEQIKKDINSIGVN